MITNLSPSLYLTAGTLALAAPWFLRLPHLTLTFLFATLIIGQLARFPLPGQGGGILLSDIAVALIILAATLKGIHRRHLPLINSYCLLLTSPFIVWSLFSLTFNMPQLGTNSFIALAYWLRLTAHLLLIPALLTLGANQSWRRRLSLGLILATLVISTLALAQVVLIPDLNEAGWDPHRGRAVSTWLDPNLLGAYLAMMIFPIGALAKTKPNLRPAAIITLAVTTLALIFTQSRSSLLALLVAVILLSPLLLLPLLHRPSPAKKVLLTTGLLIFTGGVILTAFIFPDRAVGVLIPDATVQLRAANLTGAWQLAAANSLTGVGYNAYQFAAISHGLISDFTIHSRAGADNSFITLWVTTGIPGTILFLIPWAIVFLYLIRQWLHQKNLPALAAAASLLTLFIHAQATNSFLYSHLLIAISIIIVYPLLLTHAPTPR